MSAIVGGLYRNRQVASEDVLASMMAPLHMYGPDGDGQWREGPAMLGHQMMWTTPESQQETFPLRAEGVPHPVLLTADARIDNRADLASLLGLSPSEPDSRFILQAYLKWGTACPEYLIGDFAFAIWDGQEQRLFCARDHMGLRPFYHYVAEDLFLFASDLVALLARPEVPKRLNEGYMAYDLIGQSPDPATTYYLDVQRLPPAHAMTVTPDAIKKWRYWVPDLNHEEDLSSDEAYVETYVEHLQEAIYCRMRSAYPISTELSGGLDSGTVTCLAARRLTAEGQRLITYSRVLEENDPWPRKDERARMDLVVAQEDLEAYYVVDHRGPLDVVDMPAFKQYAGFPLRCSPLYLRSLEMRQERGTRVTLLGQGGDELATSQGALYLVDLFYRGQWGKVLREVRRHAQTEAVSALRIAYHYLGRHLISYRHPRNTLSQERAGHSILTEALLQQTQLNERLHGEEAERSSWRPPTLRERQWAALSGSRNAEAFEAQAVFGHLYRTQSLLPMVDKRLIEFCLHVPPDQHQRGGWGRYLIRRATEGVLPPAIQWSRDKSDSPVPDFQRRVIRQRAALEERVDWLATYPNVATRINLAYIRQCLARVPAQPDIKTLTRVPGLIRALRGVKVGTFLVQHRLI